MSRILFVSAALAPTAALAHVGAHDFDATATLWHTLRFADHAVALIAVLTLPVAVVVLLRKRQK